LIRFPAHELTRRYALGVEYAGGQFCGWQRQGEGVSIQGEVEAALSSVADAGVAVTCAGRTDAGVHARLQVVHFRSPVHRTLRAWLLGSNRQLPPTIRAVWVRPVPEHFHARYSAQWRTYRYLILNRDAPSALYAGMALHVHQRLDVDAMQAAAAMLVGEHDFSGFRAKACQARTTVRRLARLTVSRQEQWVAVDITANAFLHHMARNIVGLLLAVGRGEAAPVAAQQQLQSRCRQTGEPTAAAHGLYLWRVEYPPVFGLPDNSAMIPPPPPVVPPTHVMV